jgi:hypothetical protein
MPARADFLTGRWTMSFMKWAPLPREEIVLGELLAAKDIHTSAVVDTPFYIRNAMGYDRGFRTFIEVPGQLHHPVIPGTPLDSGVTKTNMNDREPAMPWQFESDCFAPRTFIEAMQWLEYHYMGLMENTAIIFTTDHGFYFGEHGGMIGKSVVATDPNFSNDEATNNTTSTGVWSRSPLYQELLANPLLIYVPGVPPATYSGLTSAVDLMPFPAP